MINYDYAYENKAANAGHYEYHLLDGQSCYRLTIYAQSVIVTK